ncbi:PRC-barrel domain-containing protein [Novosphingobium anseongense]
MVQIASWIAPIATMIAAMMTAANLGARVTGWGFVVFTLGSIGWSIIGITSDQANLVATNGFLTLVNVVGIWRWLGRQRAYEDGAASATAASRRARSTTLLTATGFAGMPVYDCRGEAVGRTVEALIACASGEVAYVVVASGGVAGIAESLRAVAIEDLRLGCERLDLAIAAEAFTRLPELTAGDWPAEVPPSRLVLA